MIEKLLENVSCNFNNIFRIHMRTILKTANNEQENVSSFLIHFYTINIRPTYVKEASNIFENFNKDESEFLQRKLDT